MGRPSSISKPTGTRPDGTTITVADRIINALRAGVYMEHAAPGAGVAKQTVYDWELCGARARIRLAGAEPTAKNTSEHERECIAFLDAKEEATAAWIIGSEAQLELLARGGIPQRRVVTKRGPDLPDGSPGPILEQTEYVEHTLPDRQVLEWRLERKVPHLYGRRVELAGPDGGPVQISLDDRRRELADRFRDYLEGSAAGAEAAAEVRKPRKPRARKKA